MSESKQLTFRPLSVDNWKDFKQLFGDRGASGGCWCMLWRKSPSEFKEQKGYGNRKSMQRLAQSKRAPGILAYEDNAPIGWCAIAPREEYSALSRSRVLKPIDDEPVWSVSCFFIDKAHRKRGLSVKLLKAAVDYAKIQGANIVEGYPVEPSKSNYPAVYAWVGLAKTFKKAKFKECIRRSPTRPIMRRVIKS